MFSRRLSFVHLIRIREVTSMDLNNDKSIITKQLMPCELLQARKKTEPLRIFGIDGKTIWNIENHQKATGCSDALVRYLDYVVQIDISHEAPAEQRRRYNNLVYLCAFEDNLQGMPLIKWPGYREAVSAITDFKRQSRRELNMIHISTKDWMRLMTNSILKFASTWNGWA